MARRLLRCKASSLWCWKIGGCYIHHQAELVCTRFGLEQDENQCKFLMGNFFSRSDPRVENREIKLLSESPDFKRKSLKEARWTDHCDTPQWVTEAWRRKMASSKAGEGSSENGSGFDGRHRPADLSSSQRNEYFWTTQILQHTKCGQAREALKTYDEMRKDGVEPSRYTFVALLKACRSLQDLDSAKRIHVDVVQHGFESDLYVSNMLLDVYAKCRSLVDARHAFERMLHRNMVSWTTMILAYAQMDKGAEALQLYTQMQQEGVVPNNRTYVSALKACSSIADSGERNGRCLETVRSIHADVVKGNFDSDVFVGTMLVDAYAKCGSIEDARQVFDKMPIRDVVSWNAMILGFAQRDDGEEALQLYMRMRQEGVVPNARTYVSVLKACSTKAESGDRNEGDGIDLKEKCLEIVREIHRTIVNGKCESDVFVGNMLLDTYAKCGSLEEARNVFEKIPHRDVVSWNSMIFAYAQLNGREALQLYTRMQLEHVLPNDRTYVSALKACSSLVGSEEKSEDDGTSVKDRYLETVRAIHADVVKAKFDYDVFVETMLVDVYAKCGSLEDARCVFEKMPARTVVSWTSIISAYTQMDKGEEALKLYNRMQAEGVLPDDRTYVGALNACGSVAALEKGKDIHAQILKAGLRAIDIFVANSLISMYGKCGSMADAWRVFESMPKRDIVAWNALIAGYAHQGESELVFDLLHRMKLEGIHADGITFLGVLSVCSHAGLVDRGQMYFEAMSRDYGLTPTVNHYNCVVDLLGRAGHLDKAMEMVKRMPFQPQSDLWRCMLAACRKWVNVELGREAFECAVRLNDDDAAAYVLMSNIYAAAHMREEAKEIQAMRVRSRVWKPPGRSRWTDASGIAHVFVVSDRGHPESQDIYAKLTRLLVKMKKEGYVAHLDSVLRDMPEDEKEGALCEHSERLAIAYALLKTPEGTTIRVVKNLRVCEDCHRATALISRIERRTIICRDARRFHVFKDGKCSCGDYW